MKQPLRQTPKHGVHESIPPTLFFLRTTVSLNEHLPSLRHAGKSAATALKAISLVLYTGTFRRAGVARNIVDCHHAVVDTSVMRYLDRHRDKIEELFRQPRHSTRGVDYCSIMRLL